jgi:hypothetical protein
MPQKVKEWGGAKVTNFGAFCDFPSVWRSHPWPRTTELLITCAIFWSEGSLLSEFGVVC